MPFRVTGLAVLLVAWGCAQTDTDETDAATYERELIVGQGDREGLGFTAFEQGGAANLVFGPQGGFHFWFAARVRGFEEDTLTFVIRAIRDDLDGALANQLTTAIDMMPVEDGYWETALPVTLILCPSPAGIGADGKTVRLQTTVRDGLNRRAEHEVTVVTTCPSADGRCRLTCAGR